MRYLCTNCNYIYDESLWEKDDGIEPWTRFDELWDYYVCPVCGECSDIFQEIKEEINYIKNDHTLDFVENEHFIDTEVDWNNLRVTIWKEIHPFWDDHRITEVSLYDEYGDIVESQFLPSWEEPEVDFNISDLDDFEIRVRCSLHGLWWKKVFREGIEQKA